MVDKSSPSGPESASRSGEISQQLDLVGALCPLPVVKARAALRSMAPGELLELIVTDPLAELDLTIFCDQTGHKLVSCQAVHGTEAMRVLIRAGQRPPAETA
ncbi:MAG: sulfurtransferase TusA family protein [Wenzhouxiangella sp.]